MSPGNNVRIWRAEVRVFITKVFNGKEENESSSHLISDFEITTRKFSRVFFLSARNLGKEFKVNKVCVYVYMHMGVWRYCSTHFWLGTR